MKKIRILSLAVALLMCLSVCAHADYASGYLTTDEKNPTGNFIVNNCTINGINLQNCVSADTAVAVAKNDGVHISISFATPANEKLIVPFCVYEASKTPNDAVYVNNLQVFPSGGYVSFDLTIGADSLEDGVLYKATYSYYPENPNTESRNYSASVIEKYFYAFSWNDANATPYSGNCYAGAVNIQVEENPLRSSIVGLDTEQFPIALHFFKISTSTRVPVYDPSGKYSNYMTTGSFSTDTKIFSKGSMIGGTFGELKSLDNPESAQFLYTTNSPLYRFKADRPGTVYLTGTRDEYLDWSYSDGVVHLPYGFIHEGHASNSGEPNKYNQGIYLTLRYYDEVGTATSNYIRNTGDVYSKTFEAGEWVEMPAGYTYSDLTVGGGSSTGSPFAVIVWDEGHRPSYRLSSVTVGSDEANFDSEEYVLAENLTKETFKGNTTAANHNKYQQNFSYVTKDPGKLNLKVTPVDSGATYTLYDSTGSKITAKGDSSFDVNVVKGDNIFYIKCIASGSATTYTSFNGAVHKLTIHCDSIIYGDANDDKVVNNRDAARILQYKADWNVKINLDNADVNVDGVVNNRDAVRILQFLTHWDVVLGQK